MKGSIAPQPETQAKTFAVGQPFIPKQAGIDPRRYVQRMTSLSPAARLVFNLMVEASYVDKGGLCWLTQHQLGQLVGLHPDSVGRRVKELTNARLVKVVRPNMRDRNRYAFLWNSVFHVKLSFPDHEPDDDPAKTSAHNSDDPTKTPCHRGDDPTDLQASPDENVALDPAKTSAPGINAGKNTGTAAATRARDVAEKVPAAGPSPSRQNTPRKEPQPAAEPAGASGGMEELTAAVEAAFRAGCRRYEPGTAAEFLKAAEAHGRCRLTLAPHWIAEVTAKKRKWETGVSSARGFFLGSCRDSLLDEFADWHPPAELQEQMDAEARRAEREAIKARRTQPMPIDEALKACCNKSLVLAERLGERDAFHLTLNDLFPDAYEEDFARDALRLFASDMKREGIAECTPLELMGQLRKHQALRCPDCGDDGIIRTPMDVEPDPIMRTTPSTAEWCTCELARVHRAIRPGAVEERNAEAQAQLERREQRLAKQQAEQAGPQASDRDARLKAWRPRAEPSRPNRIAAKCTTCHDTGARLVPSDANASGMIYEVCTCAAAVTPEWIEQQNSALKQIPTPTPKQEAPALLPQAGAVASAAVG